MWQLRNFWLPIAQGLPVGASQRVANPPRLVRLKDYMDQLTELLFNSGDNVVVPKAEMEVIFEPYEA